MNRGKGPHNLLEFLISEALKIYLLKTWSFWLLLLHGPRGNSKKAAAHSSLTPHSTPRSCCTYTEQFPKNQPTTGRKKKNCWNNGARTMMPAHTSLQWAAGDLCQGWAVIGALFWTQESCSPFICICKGEGALMSTRKFWEGETVLNREGKDWVSLDPTAPPSRADPSTHSKTASD